MGLRLQVLSMTSDNVNSSSRDSSFGRDGFTRLERMGVWLSHRAVARVLRRYTRPRVLDLGSGYRCVLLRAFRSQIGPSTAVDLELDPALDGGAGITRIESSLENAWESLPENGFEVITAINVLEHVWDPQGVIDQARLRLTEGGTLVVNVPTWLGKGVHEFQAFRLGLSCAVEIDDHKRYFDKRDLWPMLVQAGFRPSQVRMRYHKLRLNLFATARRA